MMSLRVEAGSGFWGLVGVKATSWQIQVAQGIIVLKTVELDIFSQYQKLGL